MGNTGGVVIQPVLGRTADISGYGVSLLAGAVIQLASVPFLYFSRRQNPPADTASGDPSNDTGHLISTSAYDRSDRDLTRQPAGQASAGPQSWPRCSRRREARAR